MNKNTIVLCKKISILAIGLLVFLTSLILFIKSYEKSSYFWVQYETDIKFNKDYLIGMLVGIAIIAYAGIALVSKNENTIKLAGIFSTGAAAIICAGYGLSTFLKPLADEGDFSFEAVEIYFYGGLVSLAVLAYAVFKYLENKNK